jgi:tetratricopeptide (TPR) repeat protein
MRRSLLICCLLFAPTVTLRSAQIGQPPSQADSVLKVATRYLARGATDSARTLFNAVLTTSKPHAAKARLGLAQVELAEKNWMEAGHRCDTLIRDNPQDLAAHYYGGISQREWGAQVAGIYAWKKSEEHFEEILARDSLYKDVLHQYALLQEYKRNFEEAIALATGQAQVRPDLVDAQLGLLHIYRHYLSETKPKEALSWLTRQGNDYGEYFAAEALRRAHQWMSAEKAYLELLQQPSRIPVQAYYLSLAHLYACMNNPERAQACYWKVVDGINSWLGAAFVFEGLKYIITDSELEQFRSLSSDRQKIAYFHQVWEARDPMPASPTNARLIEHLQRYAQAEERYEYYGIRTNFSNPDRMRTLTLPKAFALNREFNDLGVIFLRQGPPNRIEQTMGNPRPALTNNPEMASHQVKEEFEDRNDNSGEIITKKLGNPNFFGPTAVEPHQSWIYFASGDEPQRIFNFALHNTAFQNWRLTTLPGEAGTLDREMLELLAQYDPRYDKLKKDRTAEFNLNAGSIQMEEQKVVTTALTTDRHVWSNETKTIVIPHAIDAFRGTSSGTLLDVSYAIPYAPLREAVGPGPKKVFVEVGLSTTSRSGSRVLDTKRDTLNLLLTPDGKGYYISLFRQVLVADSVRLMAHVRALQVPAVGTWTERLHVPSFAGKDFMLSDLQLLLPASYGPLIEIDGVKVQQSPFKSYARTKPLYAYLQVYNLVKDIKGAAAYTAKFTIAPVGDPDDATLLTEVQRDLADENTRSEFQMLDIKGVSPGKYVLRVEVTDRKRVEMITKTRVIEITK